MENKDELEEEKQRLKTLERRLTDNNLKLSNSLGCSPSKEEAEKKNECTTYVDPPAVPIVAALTSFVSCTDILGVIISFLSFRSRSMMNWQLVCKNWYEDAYWKLKAPVLSVDVALHQFSTLEHCHGILLLYHEGKGTTTSSHHPTQTHATASHSSKTPIPISSKKLQTRMKNFDESIKELQAGCERNFTLCYQTAQRKIISSKRTTDDSEKEKSFSQYLSIVQLRSNNKKCMQNFDDRVLAAQFKKISQFQPPCSGWQEAMSKPRHTQTEFDVVIPCLLHILGKEASISQNDREQNWLVFQSFITADSAINNLQKVAQKPMTFFSLALMKILNGAMKDPRFMPPALPSGARLNPSAMRTVMGRQLCDYVQAVASICQLHANYCEKMMAFEDSEYIPSSVELRSSRLQMESINNLRVRMKAAATSWMKIEN